MTALLVVGIILGYLMVGCGLGRITFIRILGEKQRYYKDGREAFYSGYTYDRARWGALAMLLFWPLAIWFALMYQSTPVEKLDQRQKELNDLEQELEALGRKYNLDYKINDTRAMFPIPIRFEKED